MPNISTRMSATTRSFPKNAQEFMRAVEDLFKHRYRVYVLDYDLSDSTYLVAWTDRTGTPRKSWVTQLAMDQLSSGWTLH